MERRTANAEAEQQGNEMLHAEVGEENETERPQFVTLPDGRHVAYLELGETRERAQHTLLVLHGIGSSRLANMPGVSSSLLKDYGVRLVSIDRPGYGLSSPCPTYTFFQSARDIEHIADTLGFGAKFWLLGFSMGGAYCWAAARWIPVRLAGIIMWAPSGSYNWKGLSDAERTALMSGLTPANRRNKIIGGYAPSWLLSWGVNRYLVPTAGAPWLVRCQTGLSPPDQKYLEDPLAARNLVADNLESLAKGGKGQGLARKFVTWMGALATDSGSGTSGESQDFKLQESRWGFEPEEIRDFEGQIHIWQGTDDWLVPVGLQRWVAKQLPDIVQLHELAGEGHMSWFCFNEENHRTVLTTAFGPPKSGSGGMQQNGGEGAAEVGKIETHIVGKL